MTDRDADPPHPKSGSAAYFWATARGFDLKAPHWDDLTPEVREAVESVVENAKALAGPPHSVTPSMIAALEGKPGLLDAVPTPSRDTLTGHCDVRGCETFRAAIDTARQSDPTEPSEPTP